MSNFITRAAMFIGIFLIASTCDAGTLYATLESAENNGVVNINMSGPGYSGGYSYSGGIDWVATSSSNGSTGISGITNGSSFRSFCVDLAQDVYFGGTYQFTTTQVPAASGTLPQSSPGGGALTAVNQKGIQELWAKYYACTSPTGSGYGGYNALETGAAFQVAIWAMEYNWGTLPASSAAAKNLTSGTFSASGSNEDGVAAITLAQTMLTWVYSNYYSAPLATDLYIISSGSAQDQITEAKGGETFSPQDGPNPTAPEPTTWGLAMLGAFLFGAVGWRNRKSRVHLACS